MMEWHSSLASSSGYPAARRKRSNSCRRPHPNPKPYTDCQSVITSHSSQTDYTGHGNIRSYHSNVHSSSSLDFKCYSLPFTNHVWSYETCRDRLREPLLESDLLGNNNKLKKVKLNLAGNPSLPRKSMSELASGSAAVSVRSFDAVDDWVAPPKQMSIGRSRSRGSAGLLIRKPPPRLDDHDDMTETEPPSPSQRLGIVTTPSSEAYGTTLLRDNELHPDGLWFHSNGVLRGITRCIQSHYGGSYTCWSTTPLHIKEQWWKYFKGCYQWHVDLEQSVRDQFEKNGALCLKEMVYKASKANGNDLILLMPKRVQEELNNVGTKPMLKKKSEQFSKNKLTGSKAGAKHTLEPIARLEDNDDDDMIEPPLPSQRLDVVTRPATTPSIEAFKSTSLGENELHPDGLWFNSDRVVRDITCCIQSHYNGPYTGWSTTPLHVKEQWWKYFKECYRWHLDHEQSVRDQFEKKGALRLNDMVYKASKASNGDHILWMSKEVREELMKLRATPKFQKKSEQFSKNKLTGSKAEAKHTRESTARLDEVDNMTSPSSPSQRLDTVTTTTAPFIQTSGSTRSRNSGVHADVTAPCSPSQRLDTLTTCTTPSGSTQSADNEIHPDVTIPSSPSQRLETVTSPTRPSVQASESTELHPDGLWFNSDRVVRDITRSIQSHYNGPYTCWSTTPMPVKEQWWKDFKGCYRWHLDHEQSVRDQFEKKGALRLKDMVYKASKASNSDHILWMSKEVREELMKLRATPKFKKKSEQFSKNKLTGSKAVAIHTWESTARLDEVDDMTSPSSLSQRLDTVTTTTTPFIPTSGSTRSRNCGVHPDITAPSSPSQRLDTVTTSTTPPSGSTQSADNEIHPDVTIPSSPSQRLETVTSPTRPSVQASGSTRLGDNELHPDGLWFHCNRIVRDITRCIQSNYRGPYTCWSTTPPHVKEQWWKDFKAHYWWHVDLEKSVRDQFERKGAIRLKDMIYKASKTKENDPIPWMSKEVREELKKVRAAPEFKKKSEQFSKNKLTGPKAGSKHAQGSVSTLELAKRIAAKNGGKVPPPSKMFLVTHQRNDKSFCDERSKKVWDTYQGLKATLQVQDGSTADSDLFLKAAGGYKKGTVYGLGSSAGAYFEKPGSQSSHSTASSAYTTPSSVYELQSCLQQQSEELNRTKEELQQQKQLVDDQRRQYEEQKEVQRQLYEEQKETVARLESQLKSIAQLLHGCNPAVFSHPSTT